MDDKTATTAGATAGSALGPLGALFAGAGAGLINNGINRMFASDEQRQYEKNQRANYMYSQEAQRNSARNMVEGFKMAGLSPALVAGANFSPASMASTPLQNKAGVPVDVASLLSAGKEIEMMDAQKEALKAQASKTQAEADKTNIDVGRMTAEDKESKDAMLNAIERLESSYGKDLGLGELRNFLESPDTPWNAGSLRAWTSSMDWEKALSHNIVGDVSDALDELIAQKKIKGDVADDIVNMSHSQRKLLDKQVSLVVKQLALVGAQTENTKSSTKVNEKQLDKMREEVTKLQKEQALVSAQTENIKTNTQQTKNADYRSKYASGDYKGTAMVLGLDGLHSLLNLLGLLKGR